jgi:hypothetical protein
LAQYQLSSAQRADEQQNKLYAAAQQPNFKLDFQTAIQYGAPGIAAFKAQQESSKTQGEINAQERKAALDRADAFSTALAPLVASVHEKKPITHQDVFAQANRLVAQGLLRKEDLGAIPMNAAELPKFVMNMATSTENSRKALQAYMPEALVAGGNIVNKNPLAAGGIGNVLGDVSLTKFEAGRLPILQQQANIAGGQLNLAQAKFDFEKANPTMSIQEDPSGLLAVNTRTGVATPIVYGPTGFQAAPAAAPGASMMRQQPAALPGQRVAAIPGMASVLDRTAAPVAPAAMPMPNVEGARIAGQPVGSKKEAPAKFTETDMQLANLAGSINSFRAEVAKNKNTSAKWLPTGEDTANMQAKYIALLMGVKDLYTLGALTGPDLSLIETQITNPASWAGKFTTKKGFEAQIKSVEDMIERGATNLENTYGRVPKGTRKALQSSPLGSSGGMSGATANNPLGLPGL